MTTYGRAPVPATRLAVPARSPRAVDRGRLLEELDGAPEARLVLVSAPAGFGKSTLLTSWLAARGLGCAWIALDPADDDAVRFTRHLEAAAAALAGGPDDAGVYDPTQAFDPELALLSVLDSLAAAVDGGPATAPDVSGSAAGGVAIVLDDYHVITDPAVHRLVGRLVERLPARARLVIATRSDPPLPLSRLRARGELLEVRARDLRFTASEAGEMLAAATVDLTPAEIADLTDRTEGWAAALRLAAVSLRGRSDQADLVRRFGASHRFVLDYIVEEVLAGLSAGTQDFLLRTSVLGRLCGPLCDAVTGRTDGQERLEELDRANLLIVPLDDDRCWYRYHALFADVLRARLDVLHPGEAPSLHARAAAWHRDRGDDDEAVTHVLLCDDLTSACALVAEASLRRLNAGEISTVRRWLDALPPDAVRNHAQLSASYAWCLVLPGETDGVAGRLADAERSLAAGRDGDPIAMAAVRVQLALIRSRLADVEGDAATAVVEARRARELLPAGLPPDAEATLRGDATVLLARALNAAGDAEQAAAAYAASLPDLRAGGNAFAVGRAIADLAGLAIARGDPGEAVRICETEIERTTTGTTPIANGAVSAVLARARLELGDVDRAREAATRAIELATRAGDGQVVRSAARTLARVAEASEADPSASVAHGDPRGDVYRRPRSTSGSAGLVESLTVRELEVLRLAATGASNSRIAAELFVTVGTVKSHLHTISGKLGATNRMEAVARGRELGLLD